MPETQITEDQHYVPKFYLKRFADSKGFLDVLDVKKRQLASHVVAQKDNLNFELLGAMARATPQEKRKPRHEVDEILADLERKSVAWKKQ